MKLYKNDNRFTCQATDITTLTIGHVRDVFQAYVNLGYDPREIAYTMQNAIRDLELEILLEKQK